MAKKPLHADEMLSRGTMVKFVGFSTNYLTPNRMKILDAVPAAYRFIISPNGRVHLSDFSLQERNGRHITLKYRPNKQAGKTAAK